MRRGGETLLVASNENKQTRRGGFPLLVMSNESREWWVGTLCLAFRARKGGGGGQEPSASGKCVSDTGLNKMP